VVDLLLLNLPVSGAVSYVTFARFERIFMPSETPSRSREAGCESPEANDFKRIPIFPRPSALLSRFGIEITSCLFRRLPPPPCRTCRPCLLPPPQATTASSRTKWTDGALNRFRRHPCSTSQRKRSTASKKDQRQEWMKHKGLKPIKNWWGCVVPFTHSVIR
jgi:hypothetical protein